MSRRMFSPSVLSVCSYEEEVIYGPVVVYGCKVVFTKHILLKGIQEYVRIDGDHFCSHCCAYNMKKMVPVEQEVVVCEYKIDNVRNI